MVFSGVPSVAKEDVTSPHADRVCKRCKIYLSSLYVIIGLLVVNILYVRSFKIQIIITSMNKKHIQVDWFIRYNDTNSELNIYYETFRKIFDDKLLYVRILIEMCTKTVVIKLQGFIF